MRSNLAPIKKALVCSRCDIIKAMDGRSFQNWLKGFDTLNSAQRRLLQEKLEAEQEQNPLEVIDSVESKPICPHCESEHVVKNGWQDGLQCFKCKACRKRFNRLTNTPLARLRHREKWRNAVECVERKDTLSQMQERLGVCRDTAHRWRHRLLKSLSRPGNPKLSGVVESDETFVRCSSKGQKKALGRKSRKRGGKSTKKGLPLEEYSCVWIARDRNKQTAHHVSMHRDVGIIRQFLKPLIVPGSVLCTDGKKGYARFSVKTEGIQHVVLKQSFGERVKEQVYHIQNVNNYHYRFKAWLESFKGISFRYLSNYLEWFRYTSQLSENLIEPDPDRFFKCALIHS